MLQAIVTPVKLSLRRTLVLYHYIHLFFEPQRHRIHGVFTEASLCYFVPLWFKPKGCTFVLY